MSTANPIDEYRARLQKAALVIKDLTARLESANKAAQQPIAIIGMGCRFPGGAIDPATFWNALEAGVDGIRRIPRERWSADILEGGDPALRWAGLIDSVDTFDAAFFRISPREAIRLDPQQRLLLEVVWEAIEASGQNVEQLAGSRTGVFLGMCNTDYQQLVRQSPPYDIYSGLGGMLSTAAGRIAYTFDFQGPCVTLDTACSSSLTAIHLACQSLRNGEADMALAGGVNLILSPTSMLMAGELQALSPEGRCKTFDAGANGFVRGEGCGIIVLKRLADAERDGDPILAVVSASVMNQDGRSTGLTAPNVLSQQAMLRRALEIARISPNEIDYVETHGTGTSLGDPIEFEALREVFGKPRPDGSHCALGAVKTNLGHLEGAAGVAGVIKTVLCLQNEAIPKNLHFKRINPRMSLEGTPFVIPTRTIPWKSKDKPRRAGVSSFGISGSNAHLILEEAPRREEKPIPEVSSWLLPLSAKTAEALMAQAQSYAQWLETTNVSLADIAYTASARRKHHEHRIGVVGTNKPEIAAALRALTQGEMDGTVIVGKAQSIAPKVVFVFPGQGSQWVGMSRQLFREEPTFRDALEACDEAIRKESAFSVIEELDKPEESSRISDIDVVQPVLVAIEVALAALWRSWGVEPSAVIGHSMGEVAAAHIAGALSLADATAIICRRSRLLRKVRGKGAMALVELTMTDAEKALVGYEGLLSVAVSNGPRSTVIAGDSAALDEVLGNIERAGVFCRRVKVDVASHSPQMAPLHPELISALSSIGPLEMRIPMRSTVTGERLRGTEMSAAYWADNLRKPVLFSHAVGQLIREGHTIFLEMSPHPILTLPIDENLKEAHAPGVALASLRRHQDERQCLLTTVGALHLQGYPIRFTQLFPKGGRVVALPAYPWQKERYWIEEPSAQPIADAKGPSPIDELFLHLAWERSERKASTSDKPGVWLVFADEAGTTAQIEKMLGPHGHHFLRVPKALANGSQSSALDAAIREVSKDAHWQGILYGWGLDMHIAEGASAQQVQDAVITGCANVTGLFQALHRAGLRRIPRIWTLTRGAHRLESDSLPPAIAQASLWGFVQSTAAEYPNMQITRLDVAPDAMVNEVADEIASDSGEEEIALRAHGRYVARVDAGAAPRLRNAGEPRESEQAIQKDATYLICEGNENLGLAAAQWLVSRGARNLAFVGAEFIENSEKSIAIENMKTLGVNIRLECIAPSDRRRIESIALELEEQGNPLLGVIHCSGAATPRTMNELDAIHLHTAMADDLSVAWSLHELTKGRVLDFLLFFASPAAMIETTGQGANGALGAFAAALTNARTLQAKLTSCIAWGPVLNSPSSDSGARALPLTRGFGFLGPNEVHAVLDRVLRDEIEYACVGRFDYREWLDFHPFRAASPRYVKFAQRPERRESRKELERGFVVSLQAADPTARVEMMEQFVRRQVARVLKMNSEKIERYSILKDFGIDSLMALEVRNRLQDELGLTLSATLLWAYPDVAGMAEHLLQKLEEHWSPNEATLLPLSTRDVTIAENIADDNEMTDEDADALLAARLASIEEHLQ